MLWLTAPADTGKTFILNDIVKAFMGDCLIQMANATEAGLAQAASSESLPHYLDEFEPQAGKESRVADILSLVRAATSGEGARIRGNINQSFTAIYPRFSLLLASIDRPKLSEADESRFFHVHLTKRHRAASWVQYRRRLQGVMAGHKMTAVRTRVIRHIPQIIERVAAIEEDMQSRSRVQSSRSIQMLAALSAGVEFLSGTPVRVQPSVDKLPDPYQALEAIFGALVRMSDGQSRTLAEILKKAYWNDMGLWSANLGGESTQTANRHGFTMVGPERLLVAARIPTLPLLLKGTPHQNVNIDEYIRSLPGTARPTTDSGSPVRMTLGGQAHRMYEFHPEVLRRIGFLE